MVDGIAVRKYNVRMERGSWKLVRQRRYAVCWAVPNGWIVSREERERIRALVRDTALLGVGHGSAEGFLISLLNFLEELVFVGAITKSRAVLQFLKDACKSLRGRGYAALGQARSELTLVRVSCAASSDRFVLRVLFD